MKAYWIVILVVILAALASPPIRADDRPDNIRPWVPPAGVRSRGLEDSQRRSYYDRTRSSSRARRNDHETAQYRSDIAGARQRLERENLSDRRSFDRLQRLRREEARLGR